MFENNKIIIDSLMDRKFKYIKVEDGYIWLINDVDCKKIIIPKTYNNKPVIGIANRSMFKIIENNDDLEKESIEILNLSVRAYSCLRHANINTIGEFLKLSTDDLRKIRNLGDVGLRNIVEIQKQLMDEKYEEKIIERNISEIMTF